MANIKSAKKRILTSERNRERNVAKRSKLKTLFKKIDTTSTEKDLTTLVNNLYSELDKAPSSVIHPNKASRLKSRAVKKARAILASNTKK
jgi:small subunit ribosomal protein S20